MDNLTSKQLEDYLQSITPREWYSYSFIKNPELINQYWEISENAEHIEIIGDYDCDGILSTYILVQSLKEQFPNKDIQYRLPKRITEGYGISRPIINEIHEKFNTDKENTLIITVDNGISSSPYLNPLVEEGYKVCILDHHQLAQGASLPKVTLCIDPALDRLENPFNGNTYCATAIAYLMSKDRVSPTLAKDIETFAGIATVADCMEVKEGNWLLIRNAINNVRNYTISVSLKILLKELNVNFLDCTEETFGYYLGPCFNACSRLRDDADKMVRFLNNPDESVGHDIKLINDERKRMSDDYTIATIEKVKEEHRENDYPLWLYYPDMPEGIVGIVAGHLSEEFKCPVVLLTNTEIVDEHGDMIDKGSARSYGTFNIYEYLYQFRDNLFRFGGHPGAAGLSVAHNQLDFLSKQFTPKALVNKEEEPLCIPIEPEQIPSYLKVIESYRPFGQMRPLPNFHLNIDLLQSPDLRYSTMGANADHISIADNKKNPYQKTSFVIPKFKILHFYHLADQGTDCFNMIGKISRSTYKGTMTPTFIADKCENGRIRETQRESRD